MMLHCPLKVIFDVIIHQLWHTGVSAEWALTSASFLNTAHIPPCLTQLCAFLQGVMALKRAFGL